MLQKKHHAGSKSIISVVSIVSLFFCPLAFAVDNVVLQSDSKLNSSQLVEKELGRVYKDADIVDIEVPPSILGGKPPKILMKANRDSMLDFEIKALNYSLYLQGIGTSTPENEVFANHFDGYCASSAKNEAGGQTFSCQSDVALQHGDINAGSLVEGFRYEPERETAARLFINNLVNPFPSAAASDPELLTPEKLKDPNNRKLIAQALAEQAVLSTARQALASVLAKRKPIEELDGVSFMEILEREAGREFLNDGWQQQMKKYYKEAIKAKKPELAMAYDNALRNSFTNFILYQIYREVEISNVIAAAQLAKDEQGRKQASSVVSSASGQGRSATPASTTGPVGR